MRMHRYRCASTAPFPSGESVQPTAADQVWVSDLAYVHIASGLIYTAADAILRGNLHVSVASYESTSVGDVTYPPKLVEEDPSGRPDRSTMPFALLIYLPCRSPPGRCDRRSKPMEPSGNVATANHFLRMAFRAAHSHGQIALITCWESQRTRAMRTKTGQRGYFFWNTKEAIRPTAGYRTRVHTPVVWTAILALGLLTRGLQPTPSSERTALSDTGGDWNTYTTVVGSHRRVILRDGTQIDLNTDTRLQARYADPRPDIVLEHGESFFQVKPQRLWRFKIRVDWLTISNHGASFDVYRHADGQVSVSVTQGRVRIEGRMPTSDRLIPTLSEEITAGELVTIGRNVVTKETDKETIGRQPAWMDGRISFRGNTLADIVGELNRYHSQQLVILDPALRKLRLGGASETTDIGGFVQALGEVYPIRATCAREGTNIILYLDALDSPVRHMITSEAIRQCGRPDQSG